MAASLVRNVISPLANHTQNFMYRCLSSVQRSQTCLSTQQLHNYSHGTITSTTSNNSISLTAERSLLQVCSPVMTSIRTAVRCSRRRGTPKTVRATIHRFLRLDWGIYIRPKAGRHKHAWKKPDWIREISKYHVFCNRSQSRMLDKMRTDTFKRKRYYVDDPYAPYQKRSGMNEYTPPKYLP